MDRQIDRQLFWAAALLAGASTVYAQAPRPSDASSQRGIAGDKAFQFGQMDSVNLLNGNVMLEIPIGPSYPVGGEFSYSLSLSYNSKVWDLFDRVGGDGAPRTAARPGRDFNAGLGWLLSLGRYNNLNGAETYIGPGGGEHRFFPTLHPGDPTNASFGYTRDGTYLRVRKIGAARHVEFPDGTTRIFGGDGRLVRLRDRFDNGVSVSYPDALTWRLSDNHGRVHTVHFKTVVLDQNPTITTQVVDRVVLAAFAGTTATYQFVYTDSSILRYCFDSDERTAARTTTPVLTGIVLPDGSSFAAQYQTESPAGSFCGQGSIASLTLPTLGEIEWTYKLYSLPVAACDGPEEIDWQARAPGVSTRRFLNANGTLSGLWTYSPSLVQFPTASLCAPQFGPPAEIYSMTVVNPVKDKQVYYFTVWPNGSNSSNGISVRDYGLPIHRSRPDATGTRFLSNQIFDCDGAGNNCVLKRSSYLRYERDPFVTHVETAHQANRRLSSTRIIYHDDGNRFADSDMSNFDGLGQYRRLATNGNFPGGANVRVTFTNFNPATGELRLDPTTGAILPGFNMLPASAPWVLRTFTERAVTEAGVTARSHVCFEPATGFLGWERALRSSAPASNDVLTLFTRDTAGNTVREGYFGADFAGLPATPRNAGCTVSGLPQDRYGIAHSYQFGQLRTTHYTTATGAPFSFPTVDRDIDRNTGLVVTGREASGLATGFEYDALGRLTWTKPVQDGWTQRIYMRATSATAPARVLVRRRGSGSKTAPVLARSETQFDSFGRVWRERRLMPGNVWSTQETLYNGLGLRTSVSESQLGNPTKRTSFLNYDALGRPTRLRPPDGSAHDVVISYAGVRAVSRQIKIGTALNVESTATTTQIFDRQGRLFRLREPSGVNGASVTTTYNYEVGGRLRRASTTATVAGVSRTQVRVFNYDRLGFLRSEQYPEKGSTGNGLVSYQSYDPRGNAGRIVDGANNLTYTYDRAERLVQVRETGGARRLVKTFTFAAANSGTNWRRGKLQVANRYNYAVIGTTNFEVVVAETYSYAGLQGRASNRDTQVSINGSISDSFTQSFTYNPLGRVSRLGYPRCTLSGCATQASSPRNVDFAYTQDLLTQVPGYANSITYHPSGLVSRVNHSNGVASIQAADPNGIARPAALSTAGATTNWSSGTYRYDGAGNTVAVGTSTFTYDLVSRTKAATVFTGPTGAGTRRQESYAYDAFGNLTALGTTQIPTNPLTNRLSSATVSYDAAGSLLAWNGNTYVYDHFNKLSRLRHGTEDWIFVYTADDLRLLSFKVGAGVWRWTLRDLAGQILREYIHTGSTWRVERDYVHRDGQLLAAETPAGRRHFHLDHLGTPRLITDQLARTSAYHVYLPYGQEATAFNQDTERLKFSGHERDLNSPSGPGDDIDYMRARFYQPLLARFLSTDPERDQDPASPQSWNLYSYTTGSPLNFVDQSGGFSVKIHQLLTMMAAAQAGFRWMDREVVNTELLQRGNARQDRGLRRVFYWRHAVSPFTGTEKAQRAAEKSVERRLARAIQAANRGKTRKALLRLGGAAHTVQDRVAHDTLGNLLFTAVSIERLERHSSRDGTVFIDHLGETVARVNPTLFREALDRTVELFQRFLAGLTPEARAAVLEALNECAGFSRDCQALAGGGGQQP